MFFVILVRHANGGYGMTTWHETPKSPLSGARMALAAQGAEPVKTLPLDEEYGQLFIEFLRHGIRIADPAHEVFMQGREFALATGQIIPIEQLSLISPNGTQMVQDALKKRGLPNHMPHFKRLMEVYARLGSQTVLG